MELNKSETPGIERRKFPRLSASVGVEYSLLEDCAEELTLTKNISSGGICLIVYEEIKLGTLLYLKIHLSESDYLETKGTVLWSSEFSLDPDKKKRWDIGIQFMGIKDYDQERISKYVFRLIR